jgi:hypothetical protein
MIDRFSSRTNEAMTLGFRRRSLIKNFHSVLDGKQKAQIRREIWTKLALRMDELGIAPEHSRLRISA